MGPAADSLPVLSSVHYRVRVRPRHNYEPILPGGFSFARHFIIPLIFFRGVCGRRSARSSLPCRGFCVRRRAVDLAVSEMTDSQSSPGAGVESTPSVSLIFFCFCPVLFATGNRLPSAE